MKIMELMAEHFSGKNGSSPRKRLLCSLVHHKSDMYQLGIRLDKNIKNILFHIIIYTNS
jgi:hypothetical protein